MAATLYPIPQIELQEGEEIEIKKVQEGGHHQLL